MGKKNRSKDTNVDPIIVELGLVKRLLILQLLRAGVPQATIAAGLGISASALCRMMPLKKLKIATDK